MQAVALTSSGSDTTMYEKTVYSAKQEWEKRMKGATPILLMRNDQSVPFRVAEEWDNGDPPDVVLWGEESF